MVQINFSIKNHKNQEDIASLESLEIMFGLQAAFQNQGFFASEPRGIIYNGLKRSTFSVFKIVFNSLKMQVQLQLSN